MLVSLLLVWILTGEVTTLVCHGTACHPTPPSAKVAGKHRMAVFESLVACEQMKNAMAPKHQDVIESPTQPDLTVRKQITYSCQLGEGPQ